MASLVGESLALGTYTVILCKFYGLYAALEERLSTRVDWDSLQIDFAKRRKAPLLAQDLAVLGIGPDAVEHCSPLPAVSSAGAAMGCFYVLEGATLGGQIISRNVGRRLGLTPTTGAAFFASYGKDVDLMWQATLGALALHGARHPDGDEAVVQGACATFLAFATWLNAADPCLSSGKGSGSKRGAAMWN